MNASKNEQNLSSTLGPWYLNPMAHKKFYLFFFIRTGGTKMNAWKNEQNLSSTLGPWHLNPMDILMNVFTSRLSSRFVLIAVWILVFNPLIYCQK